MELPQDRKTIVGIVILVVVAWWWYCKHVHENFDPSWENDVFLVRGYVTEQITDTYNYLRDKYASLLLQGPQPYMPKASDPALSDVYLVTARQQLRRLIDSWYRLMQSKYGSEFVKKNIQYQGVTYHDNDDGTLTVHNIQQGSSTDYVI